MRALDALEFLAKKRRTVLLGGAAVILHGLSRLTKDFDIWQDPLPDAKVWASGVEELLRLEPDMEPQRIEVLASGTWIPIDASEIAAVGSEDGMVRLAGLDRPIDVFYRPNELELFDFGCVRISGFRRVNLVEICPIILSLASKTAVRISSR